MQRPPLPPRRNPWYLFLLEAESTPGALLRPKELRKRKISKAASRIKPTTCRLVARCLNQLRLLRIRIFRIRTITFPKGKFLCYTTYIHITTNYQSNCKKIHTTITYKSGFRTWIIFKNGKEIYYQHVTVSPSVNFLRNSRNSILK
jgi:hypothetical protein